MFANDDIIENKFDAFNGMISIDGFLIKEQCNEYAMGTEAYILITIYQQKKMLLKKVEISKIYRS